MVWTDTGQVIYGAGSDLWWCCCGNGAQGSPHLQHYPQDDPSPPGLALITVMVGYSVLGARCMPGVMLSAA